MWFLSLLFIAKGVVGIKNGLSVCEAIPMLKKFSYWLGEKLAGERIRTNFCHHIYLASNINIQEDGMTFPRHSLIVCDMPIHLNNFQNMLLDGNNSYMTDPHNFHPDSLLILGVGCRNCVIKGFHFIKRVN